MGSLLQYSVTTTDDQLHSGIHSAFFYHQSYLTRYHYSIKLLLLAGKCEKSGPFSFFMRLISSIMLNPTFEKFIAQLICLGSELPSLNHTCFVEKEMRYGYQVLHNKN